MDLDLILKLGLFLGFFGVYMEQKRRNGLAGVGYLGGVMDFVQILNQLELEIDTLNAVSVLYLFSSHKCLFIVQKCWCTRVAPI